MSRTILELVKERIPQAEEEFWRNQEFRHNAAVVLRNELLQFNGKRGRYGSRIRIYQPPIQDISRLVCTVSVTFSQVGPVLLELSESHKGIEGNFFDVYSERHRVRVKFIAHDDESLEELKELIADELAQHLIPAFEEPEPPHTYPHY